ncbi:MAG: tetratricopeptide repeat protein [Armatimonadota bacterium]
MKNNNWFYLKIASFVAFLIIVIRQCFYYIFSGDIWWYLAVGKYILSAHRILKTEIFSFSAPGYPWIDQTWLAEVIFYCVYQINGFAALNVFKILIITAVFLVLFKVCLIRKASFFPAILAVLLAVLFARGNEFFGVRSYLFTYILGALYLLFLYGYKSSKNKFWLFGASGIMLLWVNSHGGFIYGFIFSGAFLIEEFINMLKNKKSDFTVIGIFFTVNLLITLVNPWGYQVWNVLQLLKSGASEFTLMEWKKPQIFGDWLKYFIYLCFVNILYLLNRGKKVSDFVILLALDYLFLLAIRNTPIFAMFTAPVLAVSINDLISRVKSVNLDRLKRIEKPASAVIIIILIIYSFFVFRGMNIHYLSQEMELFPKDGAAFLKANEFSSNIFNPYEWGGYLTFNLYPQYRVYIDGRFSCYPPEVYEDYISILRGEKNWQALLDKYNVNIIMLTNLRERITPVFESNISKSIDWKKVYRDELCAIFIKSSELKKESKILYPESYYIYVVAGENAFRKKDYATAEKLLKKALGIYPRSSRAMINLGTVLCVQGKEDEGVELFKEAVIISPVADIVHYNLGRYYLKKGDLKKSKKRILERTGVKSRI